MSRLFSQLSQLAFFTSADLLTLGIYPLHGTTLIIDSGLHIKSLNGAGSTIIDGGGSVQCISITDTGAVVSGLTIQNGFNGGGQGAGIYMQGGKVKDCHIRSNECSEGAGVYIQDEGFVTRCQIYGNVGWSGGGGLRLRRGGTVTDSLIYSNTAGYGAGVRFADGGFVSRCIIFGNSTGGSGGGAFMAGGTLRNSLLYENYGGYGGGGVFLAHDGAELNACTIVNNDAQGNGDGLFEDEQTNYGINQDNIVANTLIWENGANNWTTSTGITLSANYCCSTPLPPGYNNIALNPRFAGSSTNNYRLLSSSPCIDAGRDEYWMPGETDLHGTARIQHYKPDIGAYEYAALRIEDVQLRTNVFTCGTPIKIAAQVSHAGGLTLVRNVMLSTGEDDNIQTLALHDDASGIWLDGWYGGSTFAQLTPGPHTLHVSVEDGYGNTATTSLTIMVVAPSMDFSIKSLRIQEVGRDRRKGKNEWSMSGLWNWGEKADLYFTLKNNSPDARWIYLKADIPVHTETVQKLPFENASSREQGVLAQFNSWEQKELLLYRGQAGDHAGSTTLTVTVEASFLGSSFEIADANTARIFEDVVLHTIYTNVAIIPAGTEELLIFSDGVHIKDGDILQRDAYSGYSDYDPVISFQVIRPDGPPHYSATSSTDGTGQDWLRITDVKQDSFITYIDQTGLPFLSPGQTTSATVSVNDLDLHLTNTFIVEARNPDHPHIQIKAVQMNQAAQDTSRPFTNLVAGRRALFMAQLARTNGTGNIPVNVAFTLFSNGVPIYAATNCSILVDEVCPEYEEEEEHASWVDEWIQFPIDAAVLNVSTAASVFALEYKLAVYSPASGADWLVSETIDDLRDGIIQFTHKRHPVLAFSRTVDAEGYDTPDQLLQFIEETYPIPNVEPLRFLHTIPCEFKTPSEYLQLKNLAAILAERAREMGIWEELDALIVLVDSETLGDFGPLGLRFRHLEGKVSFVGDQQDFVRHAEVIAAHEFGHTCGLLEEYGMLASYETNVSLGILNPCDDRFGIEENGANLSGFVKETTLYGTSNTIAYAARNRLEFWAPAFSTQHKSNEFDAVTYTLDLTKGDHKGGYVGAAGWKTEDGSWRGIDTYYGLGHYVGPATNDGLYVRSEDVGSRKICNFMGNLGKRVDQVWISASAYRALFCAPQFQEVGGGGGAQKTFRGSSTSNGLVLLNGSISGTERIWNGTARLSAEGSEYLGPTNETPIAIKVFDATSNIIRAATGYATHQSSNLYSLNWWIHWPTNAAYIHAGITGETWLAFHDAGAHYNITIGWPTNGATLENDTYVLWDWDGGVEYTAVTWNVAYAADGSNFVTVAGDLDGLRQYALVETDKLPGSSNASLRITCHRPFTSSSATLTNLLVVNKPPLLTLLAPLASNGVASAANVLLKAVARDIEDGTLAEANLSWTSNKDGQLGNGFMLYTSNLVTLGTQTITCTASDFAGNTSTASVHIVVFSDNDKDGLPDAWEASYAGLSTNLNEAGHDADNDGLSTRREYLIGTNPVNFDTDGDGHPDGFELNIGTDPLSEESVNRPEPFALEFPGDGATVANGQLFKWSRSSPQTGTGIFYIVEFSTNALFAPVTFFTSVVENSFTALESAGLESGRRAWWRVWAIDSYGAFRESTTLDARSIWIDNDSDNDGIANAVEIAHGMLINNVDSDGDGWPDNLEVGDDASAPQDSDGDGLVDAVDPDSDNDGYLDQYERVAGTDRRDTNSLLAFSILEKNSQGLILGWKTVSNKVYKIDAMMAPQTQWFQNVHECIGNGSDHIWTNELNSSNLFLRLRVQ